MTKKKSLTKQDAEDMVKIILADAIAAERIVVEKAEAKLPKMASSRSELKKMALEALKPKAFCRVGSSLDIIVVSPDGEQQIEFECYFRKELEITSRKYATHDIQSDDLEIQATEKQWETCVEMLNLYKGRREVLDNLNTKLHELTKKLENYKDLAARFRLGFTGDPSDLNSVNHKCKEYLLQKGK